ncbi:MAG: OmpA family protein [Brevinematia bacterium]
MTFFLQIFIFVAIFFSTFYPSDWPVYKGNLYFTGNNDQIIVKNNNLKWLYMASNYIFNPIVSDGRVYFCDIDKILYCLEEETGKLLWKLDLFEVSGHFLGKAGVPGKVKYPVIKNNLLFVSDATAIYCINKLNGKIIWARAGLQESEKTRAVIDGIYADPIISGNNIYYGTRKNFIAREIINGHVVWSNPEIESYSGFPTFYDDKIFAQSRDLKNNRFFIICLDQFTGKILWKKEIDIPLQIFSPVVYQRKVFMPSGKKLYCLSLTDGAEIYHKEFDDYITSSPSFTDRAILITLGNRKIVVLSPENASIIYEIDTSEKSSPYFATVNDQLYVAYNYTKKVGEKDILFTGVKAYRFGERSPLWEFYPPFPGGPSQIAVSRGTLFLPAGNYLYAIGTYYERPIVYGNDGTYMLAAEEKTTESSTSKPAIAMVEKKQSSTKGLKDWDDELEDKIPPKSISTEEKKQSSSKSEAIEVEPEVKPKEVLEKIESSPPPLPDIKLEEIEVGKPIIIPNIYFEFNQAYLRRESVSTLNKIVEQLKKNPRIKLEIHGHTDNIGTKEYNQKLSEKRAEVVMEYLIKNGISPERLKAKGFGETKPIASNSTEEGRAKNRRTEFLILEK